MGKSLDEFREYATPGQLVVLHRIHELGRQEAEAVDVFNKVVREYRGEADRELMMWGSNFKQLVDLTVEQEIFPIYQGRIEEAEARLEVIRTEIGSLLALAVEKHNMGILGFVQRHYESYVGRPLEQAMAA